MPNKGTTMTIRHVAKLRKEQCIPSLRNIATVAEWGMLGGYVSGALEKTLQKIEERMSRGKATAEMLRLLAYKRPDMRDAVVQYANQYNVDRFNSAMFPPETITVRQHQPVLGAKNQLAEMVRGGALALFPGAGVVTIRHPIDIAPEAPAVLRKRLERYGHLGGSALDGDGVVFVPELMQGYILGAKACPTITANRYKKGVLGWEELVAGQGNGTHPSPLDGAGSRKIRGFYTYVEDCLVDGTEKDAGIKYTKRFGIDPDLYATTSAQWYRVMVVGATGISVGGRPGGFVETVIGLGYTDDIVKKSGLKGAHDMLISEVLNNPLFMVEVLHEACPDTFQLSPREPVKNYHSEIKARDSFVAEVSIPGLQRITTRYRRKQ
jgi:hypothetical protein